MRYYFLVLALPIYAAPLQPGERYDLELEDGSRIRNAIYRGKKAGWEHFELSSGLIQLKSFQVLQKQEVQKPMQQKPKSTPWLLALQAGYYLPMNQPHLGFRSGLGMALAASLPIADNPLLPRLALKAGFSRYSGSRALLSGPEITFGPGWIFFLDSKNRLFMQFTLTSGIAFYQLLNLSLEQTYNQSTFLATGDIGFGLRFGRWGILLGYMQNFVYDRNLPLTFGNFHFAATYFGGEL
ncbi:MAG: hypothetical protein N2Z22_07740 [Turneriella sp.]|nr:hypothetical protein [Leptospiraceae bacterium]MCX7633206.1 hypothetical protein [Turneriella sp.]